MNRLRCLDEYSADPSPLNWCSLFRNWLQSTSEANLWSVSDPRVWIQRESDLFADLTRQARSADVQRCGTSSVLQMTIPRAADDPLPIYLRSGMPLAHVRILASLRLATSIHWTLRLHGKIYKFSSKSNCPHCPISTPMTVEHFLISCSLFQVPRACLFSQLLTLGFSDCSARTLLCSNNLSIYRAIFSYTSSALRIIDSVNSEPEFARPAAP